MTADQKEIVEALKGFKTRRDELLHESTDSFEHYLDRFLLYLESNSFLGAIIKPMSENHINIDEWWSVLANGRRDGKIRFPEEEDAEMGLRYALLRDLQNNHHSRLFSFGRHFGKSKINDSIELFRSIVIRPFVDFLSNKLADAANLVTPEAARVQAVPVSRIPGANESMVFLSHKSKDKPLVTRFYDILQRLGLKPWMDKPELPAGRNLERDLLEGFNKSCAAVFFLTENFKDENYLATEIDYAVRQKRKKGEKFAIITIRFNPEAPVPDLLEQYVYQDVKDELEALVEIVRALPLELGPPRWKLSVL
jgi:hypothetical protein